MEGCVAVIDIKSFYASAECAVRHLDPFKTPLACVDPNRGPNTVVMSVTPYLKTRYGLSNVMRKKDLPKIKDMIYATPRMEMYLRLSAKVVSIFLDYVANEDLHIYSVDESFLDFSPYLSYYGTTPEGLAKKIQKTIADKTGLLATVGIGPNPFMAKVALDNEGKKSPPYIARWTMDDVEGKLWPISPIDGVWSINRGIKSHLSRIGIKSLYELAHADYATMAAEFGIIGEQLVRLANGIDESKISRKYVPENPSFNYGQTLYRAYSNEEGKLIVREIVDELGYRLRRHDKTAGSVSLFAATGEGPFSKSRKLAYQTDDVESLYKEVIHLYDELEPENIHGLSVSLGNLAERTPFAQFPLDGNPLELGESERLSHALDSINEAFGKNAVLRATSLLPHSMVRERHGLIGGHRR